MLQMIKDIANDAREKLYLLIDKERHDVRPQCNVLDLKCDKDDYWELDLNVLRNNIEEIRNELNEINNKKDIDVYPIHRTNSVEIYVEDCQQQNEDVHEETSIISNDNAEIKLIRHEPETTVNIQSGFYSRIATSDYHLLHCSKDELYAFNITDIDQPHPIPWDKDDWVIDICYSTLLKLFLIWSNSGFYTFNSTTTAKQIIENIPDTGTGWYRCTCFNDFLFLSYDHDVEQRKIEIEKNEYSLINQWKLVIKNDDDVIVGMKMNDQRIVLAIGKYGRSTRFEFRDYTMNILYTLNMDACNITSLKNSKWLVVTTLSNKLRIINNDGGIAETIQCQCKDSLLDATIFGKNMLVFETSKQLHFHSI
ncbi:unnamed protein product [Adineta steineri]|uniref:Uncharacterized protein n=2 Tax=Adineta steineri TaxID=433720 RepID=A0A819GQ05_9BILA|nr:unnamed protein product [Adineta steineri]CAF3883298.1 unnamed protein product [Adineta steineri]